MRKHRSNKAGLTFRSLFPFSYFRMDGRIYQKLYNGEAVDERTGKSIIPDFSAKVTKVGQAIVCCVDQAVRSN